MPMDVNTINISNWISLSPIIFRHIQVVYVIQAKDFDETITNYVTETSASITSVVDEVVNDIEHKN